MELACGHTLGTKNEQQVRGAGIRVCDGPGLAGNLSIVDATRCPVCESGLLGMKDVGSGGAGGRGAGKVLGVLLAD